MKTARRVITLILFIVFLIAGFTAVVILPRDEASAQQENRKLADFPSFSFERLKSGKLAPRSELW